MIGAKGLSISFRGSNVFHGINLCVGGNERVAVLGNNGSGKTSLALLLAGVIPEFIEADVRGVVSCRNSALIMQNPSSQFFALTVREELSEAGAKLARQFSAGKLLERNVFELSEGEKQKVNLLANLSFPSKALLLDEPLELLDPVEAKRFLAVLRKISGRAILWFDKSGEFVSGMKKIYLGRMHKPRLPEKKGHKGRETVLHADFSVEKNGFGLQGIGFQLHAGEKIGLIGPNGSGKTTVLKALAGMERHSGKIQASRRVSFAPQNPSHLFFQETAGAELAERKNAHKLGIAGILRRNPTTLSRGMQKVLSVATVSPGSIALLDEPTTWLDAPNKAAVYGFINNSSEAMVIATHDKQLLRYCDRVFLIKGGKLKQCSNTAANRFFAG